MAALIRGSSPCRIAHHTQRSACGATVEGVDLAQPLDAPTIEAIREAWLQHHVLAFPQQQLSDPDLVRITRYFGELGDDPYFVPISDDNPVVALTRRADEQAPVFAESWHSDWSFKTHPPIGTCLYSLVVPPVGGDTSFANQQLAVARMPAELRARLTAKLPCTPQRPPMAQTAPTAPRIKVRIAPCRSCTRKRR